MSSNYQQKKMMNALGAIDTKGNIVLEQFQDGTALLFQPGNAQPFCVATDYDRATASWSYGKYFSDLGCAYEAADPEIIEDASVRWVKEDIREKLKAQDIAPTEFNVQSVIMGDSRLWERPLDRDFRDNMIASGNDDLDARVAILKENGNFKNVDTAMPVESLDDLEQYRSDRLTDVLYASNATICYGCVLTASVCATWIRRNKKLWSIFLQELLSDMSCRRNYSFCNGTFPKPAFRL